MKCSKIIGISFFILLISVSAFIGIKATAWVEGVSHPAHEIFGDNSGLTEDATFPDLYYYFEQNLEAFGQVTAGTKFYVGGAEFTSQRLYLVGGAEFTSAGIGQTGASNFAIKTNNTDRLTVTSDGLVGIGTSTPAANTRLHVRGTAYGVRGEGTSWGGFFTTATQSGRSYVGYGNYGLYSYGNSYGIYSYGGTAGGYFYDSGRTSNATLLTEITVFIQVLAL